MSSENPDLKWEWNDETAFNFSSWANERESYNRTHSSSCVSINMTTGHWQINHCNHLLHVICKVKENSDPVFPTTPPSTAKGSCRHDWYPFGTKCYRAYGTLLSERKTWTEAKKACSEQNSTLVSIHSKEEQDFLESNVMSMFSYSWTGMYFASNKQLLHWMDNSPVDYEKWDESYPDFNNKEDTCVTMNGFTGGYWGEEGCEKKLRPYICQAPRDSKEEKPGDDRHFCIKVDFSCFKIFNETQNHRNWSAAQSFCRRMSGSLATIRDGAVAKTLRTYLKGLDDFFWIGMRKLENQSFIWSGTPSLDFYTDWLEDDPIRINQTEYCVAVNEEGKWVAKYCNESLSFICETSKMPNMFKEESDKLCPNTSDWKDLGGKFCYLFKGESVTEWYAAKHQCELEGGNLATLHSSNEIDILYYYMKGFTERLYIGLFRNRYGIFNWVDGTPVTYTNWDFGEPNSVDERCAEMYGRTGEWNDLPCDQDIAAFVCSTPKVPQNRNAGKSENSTAEEVPQNRNAGKSENRTAEEDEPKITPYDPNARCPNAHKAQWQYYGGRYCYYFQSNRKSNWNKANDSCAKRGGSLATFHSEEEKSVVLHYIETYNHDILTFHIGLVKEKGELSWDDNSKVGYINNQSEDANNFTKMCVEMDIDDGWENFISCDDKKNGFICSTLTVLQATESKTNWLPVTLSILLGTITAVSLFFLVKFYRAQKTLSQQKWLTSGNHSGAEKFDPNIPLSEQANLLPPYDEKWEFNKARLKFGKTLGQGAFGRVVKAKAIGIRKDETKTKVAVKILKDRADPEQQKALMTELKVLIYIGQHVNIVNLLGAVTRNPKRMMVIVEYCRYGNLREYLLRNRRRFVQPEYSGSQKKKRKRQIAIYLSDSSSSSCDSLIEAYKEPAFVSVPESSGQSAISTKIQKRGFQARSSDIPPKPGGYDSEGSSSDISEISATDSRRKRITLMDLIRYAFQCSKGMEYLASKQVIHRDLAARNVLLADNNIVKICDFGLAKDTYEYHYTSKNRAGLLPIKWMAIESIGDRMFSTKSDVWSFGVLLWEIFSLGGNPYPGIPVDEKFYEKLKEGYRMGKPDIAPENIYKIMTDCWNSDPADRPHFREISPMLGELIAVETNELYVDHNLPYMSEDHLASHDSNGKENQCGENSHIENDVTSLNSSIVDGCNDSNPFKTDPDGTQIVSLIHSTQDTGNFSSSNPCNILDQEQQCTTHL